MLKDFFKENKTLIIIFLVIIITTPIILLTPSPIGVIPQHIGLELIGYSGSILGGFFTLYGVWWTIKKQEEERVNNLEIQYKPIPFLNAYQLIDDKGKIVPPLQKNEEKGYKFAYCLHVTNKGRGEIVAGKIISYNVNALDKELNVSYSKDLHFIPVNETDYYPFMIKNITSLNQNIEVFFKYEYTDLLGKKNIYATLKVEIKLVNNSNPIDPRLTLIDTDSTTQYFI